MPENLNLNVLVVDDSETIRFALHSVLSENGCKVKTANDGRAALEMLKQFQADAIINDFNMPGMDGFEMLRMLQSDIDFREIPCIILTGKAMDQSTRKMVEMESNVKKVFTKPPNNSLLLDALKEIAKAKGKYVETKKPAPNTLGTPLKPGERNLEPLFRPVDVQRFDAPGRPPRPPEKK